MISNALPEVCARGKEETIRLSGLLKNLSDSRSSPIINMTGGGKKVRRAMRLIMRMLASAILGVNSGEVRAEQSSASSSKATVDLFDKHELI